MLHTKSGFDVMCVCVYTQRSDDPSARGSFRENHNCSGRAIMQAAMMVARYNAVSCALALYVCVGDDDFARDVYFFFLSFGEHSEVEAAAVDCYRD